MTHEKLIHLDLFSGIGGFALAADRVFGNVEHIFCDNDPFSQKILKKHWSDAQIYGDIRTLTYADWSRSRTSQSEALAHGTQSSQERKHSQSQSRRQVELLTGGFPCQPFSVAGRRRGTEDDRHLWPEMLRVIREFHPRWVIGENVGGFVTWDGGLVLEQVHIDLETEGYEVQAFIIPAVALNAPHRRDRVWIIANAASERSGGITSEKRRDEQRELESAECKGHTIRSEGKGCDGVTDTDTSDQRLQRRGKKGTRQHGFSDRARNYQRPGWDQDWLTVATRLCTLDDGLPGGLARPKGWRNAALKGAGNAIVPQVAEEIMRAIRL